MLISQVDRSFVCLENISVMCDSGIFFTNCHCKQLLHSGAQLNKNTGAHLNVFRCAPWFVRLCPIAHVYVLKDVIINLYLCV